MANAPVHGILRKKAPNHKTKDRENNLEPYCDQAKLSYLPEEFQKNIIKHYFDDGNPQHLIVAQLIKHTIGLLKNRREKEAVLVYLYWEPLDWETLNLTDNLFAKHHRNIEEFKHRIEQFERFKFVPLSYPEFWEMYENAVPLEELICKVRERYGFRKDFLDHYQELVLSEPDSAVSQSLKEAFLK